MGFIGTITERATGVDISEGAVQGSIGKVWPRQLLPEIQFGGKGSAAMALQSRRPAQLARWPWVD